MSDSEKADERDGSVRVFMKCGFVTRWCAAISRTSERSRCDDLVCGFWSLVSLTRVESDEDDWSIHVLEISLFWLVDVLAWRCTSTIRGVRAV